jgi:hypothetical protein
MNKLSCWIKVFIIYAGATVLIISYEGCCGDSTLPFIEITAVALETPDNQLEGSDTLKLNLLPVNLRFLANHTGILPAVFALSCPMDGEGGPKYRYTNFEILSDKKFDKDHPVGVPLNEYFNLKIESFNQTFALDNTELDTWVNLALSPTSVIRSAIRPVEPGTHTLTIRINNENNTQLTAAIAVTWN